MFCFLNILYDSSKRHPDFKYDLPDMTLIIEVDENAHKSTDYSNCEDTSYFDIGLSKLVMFVITQTSILYVARNNQYVSVFFFGYYKIIYCL